MKQVLAIIMGFFISQSCMSRKELDLPIGEDKMAKIICELMTEKRSLNYKGVPGDSIQIYYYSVVKPEVLKKNKVSFADFDTSYVRLQQDEKYYYEFWKRVKVEADTAYSEFK